MSVPTICAEFDFEGESLQVVWWPADGPGEDGHFDVVGASLPYVWREHQVFSEEFGL